MKQIRLVISFGMMVAFSGCALMGTAEPMPAMAMPTSWQAMQSTDTVKVGETWWQQFNNPELDRLIALANAQNQSWQAALQRIEQARAALQSAGAVAWPQLSGSASTSGTQTRYKSQTATTHEQNAGVNLSYEVDLWGRVAAGKESARQQLRVSQYDAAGVRLILETDVASAYFQLCALTERLALAEKNYALIRDTLTRMEAKQRFGAATELELSQQRQLVASTAASLETLKSQVQAARTALAVLAGTAPQDFQVVTTSLTTLQRPIPEANQPATLLTRRPDILQAEANLLAADANVIAARAEFFPKVTLSASGAVSGFVSGGATVAGSLMAGLTTPLFDGGKLSANLSSARARREELVATYRETVLQALKEGEDALFSVQSNQAREKQLHISLAAAQTAYRLSQVQYQVGAIDYLTLLDTQRTLINSQDSDITGQYDALVAILTLYKALGGAPESVSEVSELGPSNASAGR